MIDDGEASSGNVYDTCYMIFSACGYGNIGDDDNVGNSKISNY